MQEKQKTKTQEKKSQSYIPGAFAYVVPAMLSHWAGRSGATNGWDFNSLKWMRATGALRTFGVSFCSSVWLNMFLFNQKVDHVFHPLDAITQSIFSTSVYLMSFNGAKQACLYEINRQRVSSLSWDFLDAVAWKNRNHMATISGHRGAAVNLVVTTVISACQSSFFNKQKENKISTPSKLQTSETETINHKPG